VPLPACTEEPGARTDLGPWLGLFERIEQRIAPAVEVLGRRVVVESPRSEGHVTVLAEVVHHVPQRGLHLVGALEVMAVVPVVPDLAPASEQLVEPTRERDEEATHARTQRVSRACGRCLRRSVLRLEDEVEVVGLDREVDDLEAILVRPLTLVAEDLENERVNELLPK